MTVNRRTVIKTVGGTGSLVALAGCISASENTETEAPSDDGGTDTPEQTSTEPQIPPGEATLWYQLNDSERETRSGNVQAFNEASRHSIKGSNVSDVQKKTKSAIPAGKGPELFGWAHDLAGSYYENGFLSDQRDNVDVSLDQFTEPARNAVQYDGSLIGLPTSGESVALMYNKDMVDQPPETLSEMQSIMDDFHDPGNNQFGLGYPLNAYFYSGWAHAFGGYYYDQDSDELGLTNPETLKGFRVVIEELFPYMPGDPAYGPQAAAFADGNAPFAINGPWYLGTAADNDIDVGVTSFPEVEDATPNPYTGFGTFYFTSQMDDSESSAEAARSFSEWYVTNTDLLMDLAESHGFIPVHQDLSGSSDLPETVQGFSESVGNGTPMPAAPQMNDVWGPTENAFTKALNGKASLEDAFTEAENTIRESWNQ